MSKIKTIRQVYEFVSDELQCETHKDEMEDLIDALQSETDFHINIDGNEYRFIDEDVIDDISEDEIKQVVQECYLNGTDLDKYWWIEVDWKKTAENCINADGYGHHFSTYDGSEEEATLFGSHWYIFRTQ
jgi:hypothetical protein